MQNLQNNTPLVTVVTSSYNRGDVIHETAKSIFNQTYTNWEWYIVDDGSTDDTFGILEELASSNKNVYAMRRTGPAKGANACRNQGADAGKGEYILFLDDDDLLSEFAIEQRVKSLVGNPKLDFGIYPSLMFEKEPYDLNKLWNVEKDIPDVVRQFNRDPLCQLGGILITREAFNRIGKLDASLQLWQDIDFFLRLYIYRFKYKTFFNLPPDLHIRVTHNSLSRGNFLRVDKQYSRVTVVKNAVELLRTTQQEDLIQHAKSMFAEVYIALLRIKHYRYAKELLEWGYQNDVITKGEQNKMGMLSYVYILKLNRLSIGRNVVESFSRKYAKESTVSTVPYK